MAKTVSADLKLELVKLAEDMRSRTKDLYQRVNPWYEDVLPWKERGDFCAGPGKNVTIYNSTTVSGDVEIGQDTWVGPFCSLDGGTVGLKIGRNCSISAACHILTHDTAKWALSMGRHPYEYARTEIGDGCFIGSSSIITKGVILGRSCLVGAGSVVTKSFDDNSIIAGVPAKKIGKVVFIDDEVHFEYDSKS